MVWVHGKWYLPGKKMSARYHLVCCKLDIVQYYLCLIQRLIVCLCVCLFVRSFVRSSARSFVHKFVRLFEFSWSRNTSRKIIGHWNKLSGLYGLSFKMAVNRDSLYSLLRCVCRCFDNGTIFDTVLTDTGFTARSSEFVSIT